MTTFSTVPVQPDQYEAWDNFVKSCPGGSLFHTSLWKQVLDKSYGGGSYAILAAGAGTEIVAGFCALARPRLGIKTAVTPLLTPYTGFLTNENTPTEALQQLASATRSFGYQDLQCAPHQPLISKLTDFGFDLTPRQTLVVDLTRSEDQLWREFAPNARRNIKKAERTGIQISSTWDPAQGYSLFAQTFQRRNQRCPVGERFFHELTSGDLLAGHRRYFCAWDGDVLRACIVALHFQQTVYYQIAAADTEALAQGLPSLLLWHLFRAYQADQYQTFDFIGANTPSITRFKSGFAAHAVPYYQASRCPSRALRLLRACRHRLKPSWQ